VALGGNMAYVITLLSSFLFYNKVATFIKWCYHGTFC
jgi:hypothetical protein